MRKLFSNLSFSRGLLLFFFSVLLVSMVVVGIASRYFERRSVSTLAEEGARQTSELVFQSLYSVMKRGWSQADIDEVLGRMGKVVPDAEIALLRGQGVRELFGPGRQPIEEQGDDQLVMAVLESGEAQLEETGGVLRFIYPLKAEAECLGCHVNARVGDINGMIDVRFPVERLRVPLEFMLESIFWVFSLIFFAVAAIAFVIMRFWLVKPITDLAHHMREIDALDEMTRKAKSSSLGFREIRTLTEEFHYLLHKLRLTQMKLQERSVRDPLTGLFNRRRLDEELEKELSRSRRYRHTVGLLMIDLNRFKPINDDYGHEAGDAILVAVSRAMQGAVRESDLLARVGGDEFMVILPESGEVVVEALAVRIATAVREAEVEYDGQSLSVGASVGVALFPRDGESRGQLLRVADAAMYEDKKRWHAQLDGHSE